MKIKTMIFTTFTLIAAFIPAIIVSILLIPIRIAQFCSFRLMNVPTELVKPQFSKDGKFVLVGGMKEGNAIINISREDETYGGSILVRVEEPEEWYEKLQEEIKLLETAGVYRVFGSRLRLAAEVENKK